MATFDIDFEYNTSVTIPEMIEQFTDKVKAVTTDDTIVIKLLPNIKDTLRNTTLLSDCRLFALLMNCLHYDRKVFTMGLSHDSLCDILLPTDGSLLCLSLSKDLENVTSLRKALDDHQSQWICKLPNADSPDQYIGLTSQGIKTLSLTKWLELYQAMTYQRVDQFHLLPRSYQDKQSPFKSSCMGLLQIYRERHGSIPCGAYCPQAHEGTLELKVTESVNSRADC